MSKRCFVGRKVLEMGVASAVISFSDETKRLIHVIKDLKVEPGHYWETYYNYKDFADANEVRESLTYGCGEF